LGLPIVCSGLDKKEWDLNSKMMKFTFQNTDISIRIYKLESEHKIECKNVTPELQAINKQREQHIKSSNTQQNIKYDGVDIIQNGFDELTHYVE